MTNYLTAEAVDATLRSIAALAEGSQLIFTYVDADLINGADRFRDAASARRAVTGVGEPWTFGLRPEALPAYLEERDYGWSKICLPTNTAHTRWARPPPARKGMNSIMSRWLRSAARRARISARQRRRGTVRTGSRLLYSSS